MSHMALQPWMLQKQWCCKNLSFIYPLIWFHSIAERPAVKTEQWPIRLVWNREILVPPIHRFYQDDQIRESLLLEWGLWGYNKIENILHIPCVLQIHLESSHVFRAAISIFYQVFNSRLIFVRIQYCLTHRNMKRLKWSLILDSLVENLHNNTSVNKQIKLFFSPN